jgi:hypothetical protein
VRAAEGEARDYLSFNGLEREVVTQTTHWAADGTRVQFTFHLGKESSLAP